MLLNFDKLGAWRWILSAICALMADGSLVGRGGGA